ncbi:uncharacterized protein LOC108669462 [Hyalella azteca]|uniref:Uncharacterized protein LOC108669462 n=1 Tax=Hyalella azteca TaxID=294128 RepID=A0A8B7NF97_HYAAZ|nr:uncharacterized protein LOC108669462 [Hyalella azteca]
MQARSPLEMLPRPQHIREDGSSSNSVLFAYCYICQRVTSEPLVKNPTNHRKVLGFISERAAFGDPIYLKIEEKLQGLNAKTLASCSASFHGSCYRKTIHAGNYKKIKEQYYKINPRKRPAPVKKQPAKVKESSFCLFCHRKHNSKKNALIVGKLASKDFGCLQSFVKTQAVSLEVRKLFLICSNAMKPVQVVSHEVCWKKFIVRHVGNLHLKPLTPEDIANDEFLFYIKEKLTLSESISLPVLHRTYEWFRRKHSLPLTSVTRRSLKNLILSELGDSVVINKRTKRTCESLRFARRAKESSIKKSIREIALLDDALNTTSILDRLRSRKSCIEEAPQSCDGVVNKFPDELLLKIFRNLTTEELGRSVVPVCSRWRNVGRDPILWKDIILKRDEPERRKSFVSLLRSCRELRSLKIPESSNVHPPDISEIIQAVSSHCPRLVELRCPHRPAVPQTILQQLANNCLDLEIVDFSQFISTDLLIDPDFLLPLVKLKKLNRIQVGHSRFFFGDNFLRELANSSQSRTIEHIDVAGFLFSDDTYRYFIRRVSSKLKSLAISPSILTKGFGFIVQCIGLHELHLKVGYHATSCENQLSTLRNLINLKTLRLEFVDLSHNAELVQLFREPTFAKLEVFELISYHDNVSDYFLNLLSFTMPYLKELTLRSLVQVTDEGLSRLMQRCQNLTKLTLIDMDGVRGRAFEQHARDLPNLRTLRIVRCPRITSMLVNEFRVRKFTKNINIIWESC